LLFLTTLYTSVLTAEGSFIVGLQRRSILTGEHGGDGLLACYCECLSISTLHARSGSLYAYGCAWTWPRLWM